MFPQTFAQAVRVVVTAAVLGVVGVSAANAADEDRITVTASGRASVKPDVVEIRTSVSGNAPLAGDAWKKFRDSRRRALDAISALKIQDLKVEGEGPSIHSAAQNAQPLAQVFGGNTGAAQPGTVTVSESLTIRLSSIGTLKDEEVFAAITKVVDAAKDAGMTTGGRPPSLFELQMGGEARSKLAVFRSTKVEEARNAATLNAMHEARRRGDALAGLASAKVQRVVSVREVPAPPLSNAASAPSAFYAMMGLGGDRSESDAATATELNPITVTVTLEAQFAIAGGK